MSRPAYSFNLTGYLREQLPDFCWQTTREIHAMLEYIDDRVDYYSLKTLLCVLRRDGFLETKMLPEGYKTNAISFLYKRRTA